MNRKRYNRFFSLILVFFLFPAAVFSWEGGSPDVYFKIVGTKETEPPSVMDGNVLFFYRPSEPTRFVGAAFAHENFTKIHPFKINEYDVFYLAYPVPEGARDLQYRLIIDGLWSPDPSNSRYIRDSGGIRLSVYSIPSQINRETLQSPQILDNSQVRFVYRSLPGEKIYLAGSFNHWDPFLYEMKETRPGSGVYEITLKLFRGTHAYYFLRRGESYTDPQNLSLAFDAHGREVSVLTLP